MKDAVHRVATSCYKNLNLLTRKKVRYSKSAERFISETQQNDSGYRKIRNIVERYIKVELGETTEPIILGKKESIYLVTLRKGSLKCKNKQEIW